MLRGGGELRLAFSTTQLQQLSGAGPAHGEFDQLRAGLQAELLADVPAMGLNCFAAQVQALANLLGGKTLANQLEHFELPVSQRRQGALIDPAAALREGGAKLS